MGYGGRQTWWPSVEFGLACTVLFRRCEAMSLRRRAGRAVLAGGHCLHVNNELENGPKAGVCTKTSQTGVKLRSAGQGRARQELRLTFGWSGSGRCFGGVDPGETQQLNSTLASCPIQPGALSCYLKLQSQRTVPPLQGTTFASPGPGQVAKAHGFQ